MAIRKDPLTTGQIYHIMNKSIAGYKIFNTQHDYQRMQQMLRYFSIAEKLPKFSQFLEREEIKTLGLEACLEKYFGGAKYHVQPIAYCLMPTHLHIVVKQLRPNGISTFMSNTLNSYSRYFNLKHKRKGPLWVDRFKDVLVKTDEQLLHLTRYLHLNPTTAGLTKRPEEWLWSSYHEYTTKKVTHPLCRFSELLNITPAQHRNFVNDHIDFQRELGKIKKLLLE